MRSRIFRTESGKRQALEGAQAGNVGEAAAEEAASDAGAAPPCGEALATAWTCGDGKGRSAPVSPKGALLTTSTRARVMRPSAAKQARAPPRHTTYAAAVLRASEQEAVAEDGTSVKHMHKELEKIVRGLRGEGEGAECV